MRSRTRYALDNRKRSTQKNAATGVIAASRTTNRAVIFETMSDTLTPGYKPDKPKPQNPLSYTCQTHSEEDSITTIKDTNGTRTWIVDANATQFFAPSYGGLPALPSIAYNLDALVEESRYKAFQKFDKPRASFGEPIAELGQTLRTIKDPLYAIASAVHSFRKKRRARWDYYKKNSKALANLWLGYSVNVGPNVRTVDDAIKSYVERRVKAHDIATSFGISEFDSTLRVLTSGPSSFAGWSVTKKSTRHLRVKCKSGIFYKTSDNNSFNAKMGTRNRDIPGLIWELVPFSFVIDRIYNVKSFINAATSLTSGQVKILGGFTTTRISDKKTYQFTSFTAGTLNSWNPNKTTPYSVEDFTFSRGKWKPTLSDTLPRRISGSTLTQLHQLSDLTSLIITRLRN